CRHGITAPRPLARMLHPSRPHRIEHHVACRFLQVTVALHQDRLVAPLKYMPDPTVAAIEALSISATRSRPSPSPTIGALRRRSFSPATRSACSSRTPSQMPYGFSI